MLDSLLQPPSQVSISVRHEPTDQLVGLSFQQEESQLIRVLPSFIFGCNPNSRENEIQNFDKYF
uniref:Uncharacterized protein n=1 Tax=Solanum lycopersicum TaxID=4081 RepID=A0A3Q7G079_SOLLC